MANRKVSLVRLCKTPSGWRRYLVAFDGEGSVRPLGVSGRGQEKKYPEGHYELRYYEGRRTKYDNVGSDPERALEAWRAKRQSVEAANQKVLTEPKREGVFVRFPKSLLDRAKQIAQDEGVTLDAWISIVVAQKIGSMAGA